MSVEVFAASLDAIYATLSVEALFSANPAVLVDVIDKTDGVDMSTGGSSGISIPTLIPAAAVLISSLTEAGISRDDLDGTTVAFNGQTWRIYNSQPSPTPAGEAAGELIIFLRKG